MVKYYSVPEIPMLQQTLKSGAIIQHRSLEHFRISKYSKHPNIWNRCMNILRNNGGYRKVKKKAEFEYIM